MGSRVAALWMQLRLSGMKIRPASSANASEAFHSRYASWTVKPVAMFFVPLTVLPRFGLSVSKKNVTLGATCPPTRKRTRRMNRFC